MLRPLTTSNAHRGFLAVVIALSLVVFTPSSGLAAPPANDNFADATAVSSFPFSDSGDLNGTTTEPGEPQVCNFMNQTVWYALTPTATAIVKADLDGSDFGVVFNAYRAVGGGLGGLSFIGCIGFGGSMTLTGEAGTTYYIQAGSVGSGPASLQFHVQQVPPPPNDDFASTTSIGALPFDDSLDMTAATTEPGEPLVPGATWSIGASTWYAFTAPVTESLTATGDSGVIYFGAILAVYTGNSLASLTETASWAGDPVQVTFRANAGVTYYFQLALPDAFTGQFPAPMSFRLEVAPAPVASFGYFPSDPTIFDTVQFVDQSFDPGQAGFESRAWDLGDGTTATGCCPTHRFSADVNYTVGLTVTTVDGRTASTSQVVPVRTHDVVITTFAVPRAASAGQTRQISVGIRNSRYPETVEVRLFKSDPGGFAFVGSLTQGVPVRPSNRTTTFSFSYTFTGDDATVGKVTFKAVANLVGQRDALPSDNEAIASPTKVSR